MRCFYCDRPYSTEYNEDGLVRLICKFPRCKAQPCSDYHDMVIDCEEDMILIRNSWRNAKK